MQRNRETSSWRFKCRLLPILALILPVASLAAEKPPKAYPEEGKVIGTGINQISASRTYKIVTDTKTYELDCGKRPPLFSRTPGECGGDKKLQIGDVIHFRIEKGRAYIPVATTVDPSGEQRLRILREELKPASKPAQGTQASQPETTGTKPDKE